MEPYVQTNTINLATGSSNVSVATFTATKRELVFISAYAGFVANTAGLRSLAIFRDTTPIAANKSTAFAGEGTHQKSASSFILLSAGQTVSVALQQNSGSALDVTLVLSSNKQFTFL